MNIGNLLDGCCGHEDKRPHLEALEQSFRSLSSNSVKTQQ
jgi:hypothetical protein